jgi:uncharacterized membrane protein
MVSRTNWLYLSILMTVFAFTLLTPALYMHVGVPADEDVFLIFSCWIICGLNLIIRLVKVKGWEGNDN